MNFSLKKMNNIALVAVSGLGIHMVDAEAQWYDSGPRIWENMKSVGRGMFGIRSHDDLSRADIKQRSNKIMEMFNQGLKSSAGRYGDDPSFTKNISLCLALLVDANVLKRVSKTPDEKDATVKDVKDILRPVSTKSLSGLPGATRRPTQELLDFAKQQIKQFPFDYSTTEQKLDAMDDAKIAYQRVLDSIKVAREHRPRPAQSSEPPPSAPGNGNLLPAPVQPETAGATPPFHLPVPLPTPSHDWQTNPAGRQLAADLLGPLVAHGLRRAFRVAAPASGRRVASVHPTSCF